MKILIHDFAGHSFPVQLSRALADRGLPVLHVYSASVQTPKGPIEKTPNDPDCFDIIGISQKNGFPKYSLVKRWFAEKDYAKQLQAIVDAFNPDVVLSNASLDIQRWLYRKCKRMRGTRFIFWVQDIYSIGMLHVLNKKKLPVVGRLISYHYNRLERALLRKSDHVMVISEDFKNIIQNWTSKTNITVVENWAPLNDIQPHSKRNAWAVSEGIADKFCFLYSGTLGMKHDPNLLLQLAMHYRHDPDVVIIVISEGIGVDWLKREASGANLKNIKFYNYFDYRQFPIVLSSADVFVAVLEKMAGIFSVPSKVLSYYCVGRPVLLSVPKENLASRIVQMSKSGFTVDAGDISGFFACANRLRRDEKIRKTMGKNARRYAESMFDINQKCVPFIQRFSLPS